LGICSRIQLWCFFCSFYDRERSYLYIREGAIESNVACQMCCGCCPTRDYISLSYFDKDPYVKGCKCYPLPCCCFVNYSVPKFELLDTASLVCCIKCDCCCGKGVVLMPFEYFPFPCCCCINRITCCNNCCGCCGQVTGNPKVYSAFFNQPTDPEAFIAAAQSEMVRF
jgi:hypothetical protein